MRCSDLAAPFVLLEERSGAGTGARLYRNPVEIVSCDAPEGVEAAFWRIEDGLAKGLHAAGLFAYELGYVLEPRLAWLIPAKRDVPLMAALRIGGLPRRASRDALPGQKLITRPDGQYILSGPSIWIRGIGYLRAARSSHEGPGRWRRFIGNAPTPGL
jgi:hypothetical protein